MIDVWQWPIRFRMFLSNLIHRFARSVERFQDSSRFHVLLVYFSILVDNLLLTVVVPVVPEFLVELHHPDIFYGTAETLNHNSNSSKTFDHAVVDHHFAINARSMAILKNNHPNLSTENGQIGTILSSKAFVQLVFNPFVSPIINHLGYELTLILGVTVLFTSSFLYLIGQSFMMLLLPRALQGIASALINISGMSKIANMFRREETRIETIGFCLGGMAAGVLIGYPLGSLIYSWLGKSWLFGLITMFILLLLATQLITFNWSPTNAPTHYDSKTIDIITDSKVIFFIVIICVSTITMSLLESFLPIWLIREIRPPEWKLGVAFIPDSIGYLIGTNLFNLVYISLEYRWLMVITALWTIGASAFLVPMVPNLLYLSLPHFGIGLGIGTIDSALMPMLAELVDEKFAAQYGYVYTASQTASSTAYAFGPLFGGVLLNHRILGFETLMHLIGAINLALGFTAYLLKDDYENFGEKTLQRRTSLDNETSSQTTIPLRQTNNNPPSSLAPISVYDRFD